MNFGSDDNQNKIDFKSNEFELVVQNDAGSLYDHLPFLSPATIAAFKNIDSLTERFEEAKQRQINEEQWNKMSVEDRVVYRMGIDNEDDDQRMKVVMRSHAQGASEIYGHADKIELSDVDDLDFGEVAFDVFEDNLIDTKTTPNEMTDEEKRRFEKAKQEEMDQKLLDDKILALKNEATMIQQRIDALPETLRAENKAMDEELRLGERDLQAHIEQQKDKLLEQKTVSENKLRRILLPIEEQQKYEAKLESERENYYKYAATIYERAGDDESKVKIAIEQFATEMKNPQQDQDGKTPEAIHVDKDFLLSQYRLYLDEPFIRNARNKIVDETGEINDEYNPEKLYSRSVELDEEALKTGDLYAGAGGTIVGDKNGVPFDKVSKGPTETKSSFSNTNTTSTSSNTSTTQSSTQQRRVYTDTTGINTEDLTSTIERSVAMQKEREKIKMEHREERATKAKAVEEEQPQAREQQQEQFVPEEPKRRGFFSFFRRNKTKEKPKTLTERYNEYSEGIKPSVFSKENKPENYYEFRATAKGMAERGMILGGYGQMPLLPSKEEQMREVNRVRGFKRKVRAYVNTHRFRVTVKVAAYCAFTIGLAMIGGEASIENREQYVMAFVSMFGGLLLMNSIREDGIDLPAMPFAQPRKSDNNNRNNGSNGASYF